MKLTLATELLQLEESRLEIQKRDQEILAMSAKMKTLEEQHQDYQRHIMVLKESLTAKEEHYSMLQADVSGVGILTSFVSALHDLREHGNNSPYFILIYKLYDHNLYQS